MFNALNFENLPLETSTEYENGIAARHKVTIPFAAPGGMNFYNEVEFRNPNNLPLNLADYKTALISALKSEPAPQGIIYFDDNERNNSICYWSEGADIKNILDTLTLPSIIE